MAYAPKDLSVLAYAKGFTLWHYTTSDEKADVVAEGYFNGAADMLRVGDILITNMATDDAVPEGSMLLTESNREGTVTVGDMNPNA